MTELRLCGHSHLAALMQGYRANPNPDVKIKFVPLSGAKYRASNFSKLEDAGVRFTPEIYDRNFQERTGDTHIDSRHLWGVCMGGYPLRLDSGRQWQNCRPSALPEEGKRPISLAQIDLINAADQKATKHFVRNLIDAQARFFFIALPLPVRGFHETDTDADMQARAFVVNRGRAQFQAWLKDQGVDFIDVPDEIVVDGSYMDPDYMRLVKPNGAKDLNHGNEKYGELMIAKISKYVASQFAQET